MAYPVGEILYSSNTDNIPVAVASINFIKKNDYVPTPGETGVKNDGTYGELTLTASFQIIFFMANGSRVVWNFTSDTNRNNAYNAIISNYGYKPD